MDRCPTIEWLTGTGWKLELAGTPHHLSAHARKNVNGRAVTVSAEAATLDELTWKLLACAAEALEELDGSHAATVAAA